MIVPERNKDIFEMASRLMFSGGGSVKVINYFIKSSASWSAFFPWSKYKRSAAKIADATNL